MDISNLIQRLKTFISSVDLGMDPMTFALLLALLLFFVSLLVNLIQNRRSKARFHRMLTKEASIVSFLEEMNKYLGDLEFKCSIELQGATSPQEVRKVIHTARNRLEANIADMKRHLYSCYQYRRKEKK
ncbi:MAG: hypothetical protein OEW45_03220, partial [Deltaproteobacteria bacterium]|nr:hypothetical protein [Deltaproteobacteria bacterium]